MKIFITTLLLYLAFVPHAAGQETNPPLITVTGQAEVKVVPDEVIFNLEVVTLNLNLQLSKRENDERVKKILTLARSYQIDANDVQTDYLQITPKYSNQEDERKNAIFLGYEMSKKVVIRLRDVSKVEGLLSAVLESGANRVQGIDFRSTQMRKYRDQARSMAIKAAQEKAIALTREIGQKIGKAHSISENVYAPSYNANAQNVAYSNMRGTYTEEENTIALGQISVSASVTVSFVLE
jgi:uncharacterized protein YggE